MPETNDTSFGWISIQVGAHGHVVPLNDTKEHVIGDSKCWCNPDFDEERNLVIHNAEDGRESFKQSLRKHV